jgi:hypothetical protein
MGVLARFFGGERDSANDTGVDERALTRYRHLLGTAPIESIEQAHTEAFAALSESQRAEIYDELSRGAGTGERPLSSEPATLARSATRGERRSPGSLERTLRHADDRGDFDGALLEPVVGHVTGSPLVSAFLPWNG